MFYTGIPAEASQQNENVDFPNKKILQQLCCLYVFFFFGVMYIMLIKGNAAAYSDRILYLYPCSNVSGTTFEKLNQMIHEINATKKEIRELSTVLKYDLKIKESKKLSEKYENLTSRCKYLGETWLNAKNIYFECYKMNILKAFYREPGYYVIVYYILITVISSTIFTLVQRIDTHELTTVQAEKVNSYYYGIIFAWVFHLLVCPFLFWHFFFIDEIDDTYKKQFPIYPRFYDVNYDI